MDILTMDISGLSYKIVKEKVDEINVNELHDSQELINIIDILKADKRKNINTLGDKLQRAKEKIENEMISLLKDLILLLVLMRLGEDH